jgi:hypothetical protein
MDAARRAAHATDGHAGVSPRHPRCISPTALYNGILPVPSLNAGGGDVFVQPVQDSRD